MSFTKPLPDPPKEHSPPPPSRKFGLHQVYPDPSDPTKVTEAKDAKIDIIALHGLDAQSPTTWIAWKEDGEPQSGDVHWLRDPHMLPLVIPKSRILTYDWNANYDKTASSDIFLGHADTLLDRIYVDRKDTNRLKRPVIFIASCFSGLLLAKTLLRAHNAFTDRGEKYREILQSTVGVTFLGTPFQGSWDAGYNTAQLRIAYAAQIGSESSQELIQYLQKASNNRPSPLDELVQTFCEMINHKDLKNKIVCFYESRNTNHSAIGKKLPEGYAKEQLNVNGHGIVVTQNSACLQGVERVGLDVRHNMLHKFNHPRNDGFKRLSLRLKEFAECADEVMERRGKSINDKSHHTDSETQSCLKDLRATDPRDDKKRIEETKGGLLKDSYRWILEHSEFQQWRYDKQNRVLWIKGNPGKGKTMLLCGIINELKKSIGVTGLLSFFFCQATDTRINNATAVLRGLIYLLVDRQPSLISHVRKKYDTAGKQLFEDVNAWMSLSEIFTNILKDPSLQSTYLIIDALDECTTDLSLLLNLVVKTSSAYSSVKWIVSSRNWPSIEKDLDEATQKVRLCLELNEKSVSEAVTAYVQFKVNWLAERNGYDSDTRDAVQRYLSLNADGTFLWVALVCQNLEKIPLRNTCAKLTAFPPGLDSFYQQMIKQINNSDNADLCKQILASTAIVYRPITLKELTSLVERLEDMSDDLKSLQEIIGLCGSFLTIREETIYFVHQSAKDYLLINASDEIFLSGKEKAHYVIFSRSLEVMSRTLQLDVYSLSAPGISIEQVKPPDPDPLAVARYSCLYWVGHLLDSDTKGNTDTYLEDGGLVDKFLRQSYLYWLEALSILRSLSSGVVMIRKLENRLQADRSPDLYAFVDDAKRFALYNRSVIEQTPLQIYCSALVFSPEKSIVRVTFENYIPPWIQRKPKVQTQWSALLQTLEGHSSWVLSVAFSPDGKQIVSGSDDNTVRLWDATTGAALQTLKGHSTTGAPLQTLKGHSVTSVAFSPDGKLLPTLRVRNYWLVDGITNILWLPTDYRPTCEAIWDTIVILGHSSGRISFLRIGEGPKLIK
ncbi:NACHT-domain-containing protein [Cadophora sp. DSE1049]|nr:NACHT-domain-containing protein [Cadophora sp. DSE1049]